MLRIINTINNRRFRRAWVLLAMALTLLVLSPLCLLMRNILKQAEKQRIAVAQIQSVDGIVVYDYQVASDGSYRFDAVPPTSRCLRLLLGEDVFHTVVGVGHAGFEPLLADRYFPLDKCEILINGISALNNVRDVQLVDFTCDDQISSLRHLQCLYKLDLSSSGLSDDEVEVISSLTSLRELILVDTTISDKSLRFLGRLPNIKKVVIKSDYVSEEGIRQLRASLPHAEIEYIPYM